MKIDRYSNGLNMEFYKANRREEVWNAVKFMSKVIAGTALFWIAACLYLIVF